MGTALQMWGRKGWAGLGTTNKEEGRVGSHKQAPSGVGSHKQAPSSVRKGTQGAVGRFRRKRKQRRWWAGPRTRDGTPAQQHASTPAQKHGGYKAATPPGAGLLPPPAPVWRSPAQGTPPQGAGCPRWHRPGARPCGGGRGRSHGTPGGVGGGRGKTDMSKWPLPLPLPPPPPPPATATATATAAVNLRSPPGRVPERPHTRQTRPTCPVAWRLLSLQKSQFSPAVEDKDEGI